jgi:hypothetical protein
MPILSTLPRCAAAGALLLLAGACASVPVADPAEREWIQLFNGENLEGWTPKFAKHPLGENFNNTFRVEDGLLEVRYDNWTGWDGEFGHLFYDKRPFTHYLIGAEYRFVGNQVTGAPRSLAWAKRNNGLMLHAQSPESMELDQDFPNSIEVQLLGGLGEGPRSTANLCTPGTVVEMNGQLHTPHCTNSTSPTFDGDQWVRVEVLILGDSVVKHIVQGDTVLEYTHPQLGEVRRGETPNLTPLTGGYITIQAESAEIDFRKIEVLDLEGCTDPQARNYKSYFVKSDPARCAY